MTLEEFKELAKDDDWTPGWSEIDKIFSGLYPDQPEPMHLATKIESRRAMGGEECLDGISFYKSKHGYIHVVTYGMSELYANEEALGGECSKWGYEMTMKIKADDPTDCIWAAYMLGTMAKYTVGTGNTFRPYQYLELPFGEINGVDSKLVGCLIVPDTEVKGVDTIYGRLEFMQLVGVTAEELDFMDKSRSGVYAFALADILKEGNPFLATIIDRDTKITQEFLNSVKSEQDAADGEEEESEYIDRGRIRYFDIPEDDIDDEYEDVVENVIDLLTDLAEGEYSIIKTREALESQKEMLGITDVMQHPSMITLLKQYKDNVKEMIKGRVTKKLMEKGYADHLSDPPKFGYFPAQEYEAQVVNPEPDVVVIVAYYEEDGVPKRNEFVVRNIDDVWVLDQIYYAEGDDEEWHPDTL